MPSLSEKFREMFSIVNKKYMNDRVGNILSQCTSSNEYTFAAKIKIFEPCSKGFEHGKIYIDFPRQSRNTFNKLRILDNAINNGQTYYVDDFEATYPITENYFKIPIHNNGEYLGYYEIENNQEKIQNEYRKFIEENRYGRIKYRRGEISIPRIQCAQSNGNNIKYASRRLLDDMGK